MSTKILFNIRHGPSKSLRGYITHFNEATINFVRPNQETFMGAFQNRLKTGHSNASFAQNPTLMLVEIVARAACYINGEETNAEKKDRDAKECIPGVGRSFSSRKNNYPSLIKDKSPFKRVRK